MSLAVNQTSDCSIVFKPIHHAIIRTLIYFDLFKYPLRRDEIQALFTTEICTRDLISSAITELVDRGLILEYGDFLLVQEDTSIIDRRLTGNALAYRAVGVARRIARLLANFPFVRGVMLSGSLSKNYMDAGSDFDFFIITAPRRLWLCRSLLAAARKAIPKRWNRYFCFNYFIDAEALEIPDRNLFTATELAFLRPLYSMQALHELHTRNSWFRAFYPNPSQFTDPPLIEPFSRILKQSLEYVFRGRFGDALESRLLTFTQARWRKRQQATAGIDYDLNFRAKRGVSKQHEKGHQRTVLSRFAERLSSFENQHSFRLSL